MLMRWIAALVIGSCSLSGGCAPWATYPPDEGGLDLSGPRTEPVPTLMVESVQAVRARTNLGSEFAVNLPPGTPPQVYDWVLRRIGSGHAMEDPAEPAFHVTKVRVRGRQAQVDVFFPDSDGEYEFATLTFTGDVIAGYALDGTRIWHTNHSPPPPGYLPAVAGRVEQQPLARDSGG